MNFNIWNFNPSWWPILIHSFFNLASLVVMNQDETMLLASLFIPVTHSSQAPSPIKLSWLRCVVIKINIHDFMLLQVILYFYCCYFTGSWNQINILHWKCMPVFTTGFWFWFITNIETVLYVFLILRDIIWRTQNAHTAAEFGHLIQKDEGTHQKLHCVTTQKTWIFSFIFVISLHDHFNSAQH